MYAKNLIGKYVIRTVPYGNDESFTTERHKGNFFDDYNCKIVSVDDNSVNILLNNRGGDYYNHDIKLSDEIYFDNNWALDKRIKQDCELNIFA